MYFAKNVAYFPFNFWLSFQRLSRLLCGYNYRTFSEQIVYTVGVVR